MSQTTYKTAIFAAIRGFGLIQSRTLLIKELLSAGWRVVAATVEDEYTPKLIGLGATFEEVPFSRGGLAVGKDTASFLKLRSILKTYQPRILHLFHGKPVILGGIAAKSSHGTVVVSTITGLGNAFINDGYTRKLSEIGYRQALRRNQAVIFQNHDDEKLFINQGWIEPGKAHLILGAGVDINRFHPSADNQNKHQHPIILMVTRLLWQKGVREFVESAREVKQSLPEAKFQLAGEWDPVHPDSVDKEYVSQAVKQGTIEFLGYLDDMPQRLRDCDIFVLPSYREGVPRVLMEASASGVPVIATDAPGCREAVIQAETGLLVPARDSQALAQAIVKLLNDAELRMRMGKRGREFAEQKFDIRMITQQYLDVYRKVGVQI